MRPLATPLLAIAAAAMASLPFVAGAANPFLDQAQQAYEQFEYDRVIPLLDRALRLARTPAEEVAIYSFLAQMHVTYDRTEEARRAFVEVLRRQPDFVLPQASSPKIAAVLDQARAEAARKPSAPVTPPPPGPLRPPIDDGAAEGGRTILGRWWFWTAIGAVVVGVAGGVTAGVLASRPPDADHGPYLMAGSK